MTTTKSKNSWFLVDVTKETKNLTNNFHKLFLKLPSALRRRRSFLYNEDLDPDADQGPDFNPRMALAPFIWLQGMAIRVVEFTNGGYKIRKIFA